MSGDVAPDVSALAINVTIPEELRWTDVRRGEEFMLTTLNIRLLPDGRLAAKAYGRPVAGGRGTARRDYRPRPITGPARTAPARTVIREKGPRKPWYQRGYQRYGRPLILSRPCYT